MHHNACNQYLIIDFLTEFDWAFSVNAYAAAVAASLEVLRRKTLFGICRCTFGPGSVLVPNGHLEGDMRQGIEL